MSSSYITENARITRAYRMIALRESEKSSLEYRNILRDNMYMEGWLKAPNGKDTHLTERQWIQVRTPSFMKWFGDWINHAESSSKAVDENGEPIVVYHGTYGKFGFSEFNPNLARPSLNHEAVPSIYTTSNIELARQYAMMLYGEPSSIRNGIPRMIPDRPFDFDSAFEYLEWEWGANERGINGYPLADVDDGSPESVKNDIIQMAQSKWDSHVSDIGRYDREFPRITSGIYASFINIRNPLAVDAHGRSWHSIHLSEDEDMMERHSTNELAEIAMSRGCDGMIIRNVKDGSMVELESDIYVAFNANQLKSATENIGDFSSASNSILD